MMATRHAVQVQPSGEIEALLPWRAAGTLNARDTHRVDDALGRDPELARQYEAIREEYAETILLEESLGAPSPRAMQKLFAAIDAEPTRAGSAVPTLAGRVAAFLAGLSPRTLTTCAAIGAVALMLQAATIGAIVMQRFDTAAVKPPAQPGSPIFTRSITGDPTAKTGPHVLVRFTPATRMSDITALLDAYQATIIDGDKAGLFRLQLGRLPMSPQQVVSSVERLQNEKIVSSAAAAP
jgi:hypothetical protein